MTQLPPDDRQWQTFLRKYRPTPPPAPADLENQLMNAIKKSQQPVLGRLWAVPPAIAAGLLMAWSSYRLLTPIPDLSNSGSLEAFMQDNWNEVVGETQLTSQTNSTQADWTLIANTAP